MVFENNRMRLLLVAAGVLVVGVTANGAELPVPTPSRRAPAVANTTDALRDELLALAPTVRRVEAERLARCALETSERLRRDYHVVGSPWFHNFLVNAGIRKRGLCFQWARDLMDCLAELHPKTLDLHWGAARAGTLREHNCVVVTAKGQPFTRGIVLDAWRHSGRLFTGPVATDHYPWKEDLADCLCARRTGPPIGLAHITATRQHAP